jgi:DNA polymerase-3 subunit alpha/error-prone DNA polymerase
MVYQEDVIKLHFFGVPASDGDVLRRAMVKDALWLRYKSKDNFFACCAQKDIP